MSFHQRMMAGRSSAVMTGRFGNVTFGQNILGNASGTTYSLAPTLGPATATRYVCMYLASNNTTVVTIGGVTATATSHSNSINTWIALVPTGVNPTIAISGLTSGQMVRGLVYSMEAASVPIVAVGGASNADSTNATAPAVTVPANGFLVAHSVCYSSVSYPTITAVSAGYTLNGAEINNFNTYYYTFHSATMNAGLTGSQTPAFTYVVGGLGFATNQVSFS